MTILKHTAKIITNIIIVLSITFLLYLSLISLKKQAIFDVPNYNFVIFENNNRYFILSIILSIIFLIILTKYILIKIKPLYLFLACSTIYSGLFLFLLYNVPLIIRADQIEVYLASLKFSKGDYSSFYFPNYIYTYPHQLGLVTFERLLFPLVGFKLKKIFFLYFIMIILINFLQWKITKLLFTKTVIENLTILLSFLFIPHLLLTLFVYGQTPGLLLLLCGIYLIIYSEKQEEINKKYTSIIFAIIFISLASYIRNNYVIIVIAVIIIFSINTIKYNQKKYIGYILLLIITNFSIHTISDLYYAKKIGVEEIKKGMPNLLWVNMGIQENDPYPSLPGWWSSYNINTFANNLYNYEKASEVANIDFNKRIDYFKNNPQYAFKFANKKIENTWLDPTFQSIWAGPIYYFKEPNKYNKIVTDLYTGVSINTYFYFVLKIFLTIIYIFSAIGLIQYLYNKEFNNSILYIPLFFIGTFIFHLIWETKPIYVYPAFYMLIPFSAYCIFKISNIKRILTHE